MNKTSVVTGFGPGVRITGPATGKVTVISGGRIQTVKLNPTTVIRFAA